MDMVEREDTGIICQPQVEIGCEKTHVLVYTRQTSGRTERRVRPQSVFGRVVHTKDFATMADRNGITRRGGWRGAARLTALASVNRVQLVIVHHLAQLSQHLCRLARASATVSFFSAVVGQQLLKRFDAFAAFDQM